jgi:hypothetical protein
LNELTQEAFAKARTFFRNHHQQMNYAERVAAKLPIGSGKKRGRSSFFVDKEPGAG